MPTRQYTAGKGYRYGFNGKENDNEVKGEGNSVDFGARVYDSRIGRWASTDPHYSKFPDVSPYNFAGNNPIFWIDPSGGVIQPYDEKSRKNLVSHFERIFNATTAQLLSSRLDTKGTFNPIDPQEFNNATKGLSLEQRALATEYYLLVNNTKTVVALIGGSDSKIPNELLLSKKDQVYKGKTLGQVSAEAGALTSVNDDQQAKIAAAVFINTELDYGKNQVAVLDSKGYSEELIKNTDGSITAKPFMDRAGDVDEVTIHEFGHALFQGALGISGATGDWKVIQTENTYRTNQNKIHKKDVNYQPLKMRSGINHRNAPTGTDREGTGKNKPDYRGLDITKTPEELTKKKQ